MERDRVAGILLAAGLSSRMGENKLLLKLNGESVVRRAALTARAAGLEDLLVVVGHEREKIEAELAGIDGTIVLNANYLQGMNSSLHAGIAAVPESCAAALVTLADMPLVEPSMLRSILDSYRATQPRLVLSLYEDVLAPPVLYRRDLFAELLANRGEENRKRVIETHRAEATELRWPKLALTDLDRPQDLERVKAAIGES